MYKVLIIDDEKDICFLISEILKDEEYITTSALNSDEAINTFTENKPDLVQFHGFNGGEWGLSHLLACKEYSIKTFLWHNVPSITCMEHQLLYMSKEPCDGKFSLRKCTSCRLNTSMLVILCTPIIDASSVIKSAIIIG